MNGQSVITVTVEDSKGKSITESFVLTVVPASDQPFLVKPVAEQSVNASYKLAVSVSRVRGEYFDDIDNEALTFIARTEDESPLPDWTTIVGDSLIATTKPFAGTNMAIHNVEARIFILLQRTYK